LLTAIPRQKLAAGDPSASVCCLALRTASSAVAAAATNFLGDFVRDSTCRHVDPKKHQLSAEISVVLEGLGTLACARFLFQCTEHGHVMTYHTLYLHMD